MADKTYKFVCVVCGFEVEVDTPELPEAPCAALARMSSRPSRSNSHPPLPGNWITKGTSLRRRPFFVPDGWLGLGLPRWWALVGACLR